MLVCGDSHVHAIDYAYKIGLIQRDILVKTVGGATAIGLNNPNSKTNACEIFLDFVNENKKYINTSWRSRVWFCFLVEKNI